MISVVISTLNREDDLRDLLTSLGRQDMPRSEYQVIVVDNGSMDKTESAAKEAAGYMNLVFIREPKLGVSHARNAGIKTAAGRIIAFIDDDAVADPGWLTALNKAHLDEALMCTGGRILGDWQCERPRWFHPGLDPLLSLLDLGDTPREFRPPSNLPVGANISFKREVFDKYGYFNTSLGRMGKALSGGEELELSCKLMTDGAKVQFLPNAVVTHKVRADRMKPGRILTLAYRGGLLAGDLRRRHPIMRPANRDRMKPPTSIKAGPAAFLFKLVVKSAMAAGYLDGSIKTALRHSQE